MKALTVLAAFIGAGLLICTNMAVSSHLDKDQEQRAENTRLKAACGKPRQLRLPYTRSL